MEKKKLTISPVMRRSLIGSTSYDAQKHGHLMHPELGILPGTRKIMFKIFNLSVYDNVSVMDFMHLK